ncbi:TonB family protein [Caulobacter sp. 73W]|uniref:TonB family protein n=1 Tax=Caulobacter sp. 73W TaxID=3161137 RepID=A0AB39KQG7_9CAUL
MKPSGDQLADAYPPIAQFFEINGHATIRCRVDIRGMLFDCEVVAASPSDLGFGQAALSLTDQFLMRPKTVNGQPVESGTVAIPINFTVPKEDHEDHDFTPPQATKTIAAEHRALVTQFGERVLDPLLVGELDMKLRLELPLITPGVPPATVLKAREAYIAAYDIITPKMKARALEHVAQTYPEEELADVIRFFDTPSGQTFLQNFARMDDYAKSADPAALAALAMELNLFFQSPAGLTFANLTSDLAHLATPYEHQIEVDARRRFCQGRAC